MVFTEGAAEAGRPPGDVPVCVPVLLAGGAHAGEEVLTAQHLLSLLSAVCVVKVSIIVINFLIGEYCLDGVNNAVFPVVCSRGVCAAGMVGQTEDKELLLLHLSAPPT